MSLYLCGCFVVTVVAWVSNTIMFEFNVIFQVTL